MAETITILGKAYPKVGVAAAAAAVIGFVGYAWWKQGISSDDTVEADLLVPEVPEEPTGVLPFSGTQSGTFREDAGQYRTDQEWYSAAVEKLLFDYGVDGTSTASQALDRYLASQPLTSIQVPMITYVVNSIGPPPSGARTIRQETGSPGGSTKPPPGSPPGAVVDLRASTSRTQMRANWRPPSSGESVQSYRVRFYGGRPGGGTFTVSALTTKATDVKSPASLVPNRAYGVEVTPVGVSGQQGPVSRVTRHTRT